MRFWLGLPSVVLCLAGAVMGGEVVNEVAEMNARWEANPVAETAHPEGLVIADGNAHATIVIPAEAGSAELYAARDLQEVLHEMTGVALPVATDGSEVAGNRILIGATRFTDRIIPPTERADVGEEGYIVRLAGRDLAIAGGGPYSVIFGVAEIYDRLGARWYLPGPLGACVPRLEAVRFAELDVARRPSFVMRWVGSDVTWDLRNRTNRIDSEDLPPAFEIYSDIYHTQDVLLPVDRYFDAHPEYFALVDGQRRREYRDKPVKLCNSNPDVARELAANMARAVRERPGINLLSLSPTDGQNWCQCEDCLALDEPDVPVDQRYSRRQMVLYNRVASELEKEFPDRRILVGAYNVYTWPPKDPEIKGHRNLAVVICHYNDYCLSHPVNDTDCEPNARYLELIRAWQEHTRDVCFYEYYNKINWLNLPWPLVRTISADVPFFHEIGVRGVYTQWSRSTIWTNFINMYVAARLLWDHTTDVQALLDEFYPKFYCEAAGPMRRYHEALEERFATCGLHVAGGAIEVATQVFPESLLAELDGSIAEAGKLAEDDLVKRRVAKIADHQAYTRRLMRHFRLVDEARASEGAESRRLLAEAVAVAESLQADAREHPERYEGIASWAFFVPNKCFGRSLNHLREELAAPGDPE